MSTTYVIAATGLAFEARLVQKHGEVKVCCGYGAQMAVALATAIGPGCAGIVSFGIAGGLDPQLRAGTHIVASSVIGANGVRTALPTDERWATRLLRAHPQAVHAPILGLDTPATDPAEKVRLFRQTGAAAVDMESHIAAAVGLQHGLPVAVLRVVADPARQRLPQAALTGMRQDGSFDTVAMLQALWRRPAEIPGIPAIARNTYVARAALARALNGLSSGFGLFDLG
jgi:hopanoid-associated phosphorylase